MPRLGAALSLLLVAAARASGNGLTPETWDAAVAGKSVLLKFQAPW